MAQSPVISRGQPSGGYFPDFMNERDGSLKAAENPRQRSAVSTASSKRVPSARSGTVLQEVFARKRETEQLRLEKHSAVAQYYDKWGRITSRFENWTTPEYYEKSDQLLRKDEEEKRKREALTGRRQRLKELLDNDNEMWIKETKEREREKIKPSSAKHDVDVLQRLNESLSEQEKRKKEIEAKLYSRWRFGMTRDELILEAKNHHQAMAKLNWMDQQVEEQLERDRSNKELAILEMQRQSEQLRQQEVALEASRARETELQELNRLLEFHVNELKAHEAASRALKETNSILAEVKENLDVKLGELESTAAARMGKVFALNNLRKLKILIQDHCKEVHEGISQDILQLGSIKAILRRPVLTAKEEKHFQLLSFKFTDELAALEADMEAFMTRYDSELKGMLIKQQQTWKENSQTRFRLLKNLLEELIDRCASIIEANNAEVASLIPIKESHLKSIEDLNQNLTTLTDGDRRIRNPSINTVVKDQVNTTAIIKKNQQPTFTSLGEQLAGLRLPDNIPGADKSNNGPRFGRKKVAWC